jgi:hypothetical protein
VLENDNYVCAVNLSQLVSRLLFKMAFMINSHKWVLTILEIKNNCNKQHDINKTRIIFITYSVLFSFTAIANIINTCSTVDSVFMSTISIIGFISNNLCNIAIESIPSLPTSSIPR